MPAQPGAQESGKVLRVLDVSLYTKEGQGVQVDPREPATPCSLEVTGQPVVDQHRGPPALAVGFGRNCRFRGGFTAHVSKAGIHWMSGSIMRPARMSGSSLSNARSLFSVLCWYFSKNGYLTGV